MVPPPSPPEAPGPGAPAVPPPTGADQSGPAGRNGDRRFLPPDRAPGQSFRGGRRANGGRPAPLASGGPPEDAASAAGPDRGGRAGAGQAQDGGQAAGADPSRIQIDMEPIRRQIVQQFVPDGRFDQLTQEERRRVFSEVNQRMLGIQEGIQMLQQKVAERVADAQSSAGSAAPAARQPAAPSKPAASAPVAAPRASRAAGTAAVGQAAFSGRQLQVRLEQNGEVVSQLNAELNLPNVLSTVFASAHGEQGEVPFAVGNDGRLYTRADADKERIEALGTSAISPDAVPGTTVLPGWVIVTKAGPSGLVTFGIARPLGAALGELRRTTVRNAGFGFGIIVLALVGIVPLSTRLTRNLTSLSDGVRRIAQGDYSARVQVRSHDEVGRLAEAFNQMAADVEVHQRSLVEQARIRHELELGRQIQHDMLPHVPLRLGLTEVKGVSVPAREVGGDFFNYFELSDGTVALLVGDVSGKGVGAALLMANIQASLRTRLALGQDLAALARELDRDIEQSTPGPVYATLFVGIFDPATRRLRCVNAGHNPQYVLRAIGGLERLESTGLPIGLMAGRGYTEQRVQLAAGDLLFFYTDGCVEAENPTGEMYGADRLEQVLRGAPTGSADDILVQVEGQVAAFRAGIEPFDDATMMVVKIG